MTHLLFIDSDVQFEGIDVIKMIIADKDIIGGIYAKKRINWERITECVKDNKPIESLQYNTSELALNLLQDSQNNKTSIEDIYEPLEVKDIATGMMLIKCHVFEKMIQLPVPKYKTSNDDDYYYSFFDCKIKGDSYLSEDNAFCDTWREMGGKVYAALWTKTIHYGNMGIYTDTSRQ